MYNKPKSELKLEIFSRKNGFYCKTKSLCDVLKVLHLAKSSSEQICNTRQNFLPLT